MKEPRSAAVDLQQTHFEAHAKDDADLAQRFFWIFFGTSAIGGPVAIYILSNQQPGQLTPTVLGLFVGMFVVSGLLMPGFRWWKALRRRPHFLSRSCVTWTLSATNADGPWHVEGFGPCEGWRTIWVECKTLPKRPDKRLAVPNLRVMIDNATESLKTGEIAANGERTSVSVTDKAGEPVRILIDQARPEDASEEERWVVEIGVRGDPNPPDTLQAWQIGAEGSANAPEAT